MASRVLSRAELANRLVSTTDAGPRRCAPVPDQHDQPLAAGDASIEKVPLQHGQSHAFETNNTACGTYDVFWMGSALLRINVSQAHYRAAIPYELNYFKGL